MRNNNSPRPARRQRANDGYVGKVVFWFGQLQLALNHNPAAKYPVERCWDSLEYFASAAKQVAASQAADANAKLMTPWELTAEERKQAKQDYQLCIGRLEDMHSLELIARLRCEDLDEAYMRIREYKLAAQC